MSYDPELFDVNARLKKTISLLRKAGQSYAQARVKMAEYKIDADVDYAKAYMATDSSLKVDERKSLATQNSEASQRRYVMIEAEVDALKQTLAVLSNTLNGLQTQARLLTTQLKINDYD